MKQPYLECGKIINTHGFRGTVKLESFCDCPEVLAELETLWFFKNGEYTPRRVLRASVFRQFVLADIEGVTTEEAANALRGTVVYAKREDIPLETGDVFIVDLIGLPVKHAETGALIGELIDVNTNGARDLYIIRTEKGDFMVPAVEPLVARIDPDDAVYVNPIPGLLDGGAENV